MSYTRAAKRYSKWNGNSSIASKGRSLYGARSAAESTNNNTKNEVKNELNNNENTNTTTNEPKEETPKTDLEKAIDIVKKDWGADNTVYFAQDGQKESGEYIICVRDTETTSAKAWYTVNVQTGTFVKE